jgi:uncharacterized protein involved in outer membrane biogenesis
MGTRKKIIIALVILVVLAVLFGILVGVANRILKAELEKALGENFRVARIGLSWGTVEAEGVQLLRNGKVVASVKKLGLKADFLTIFRKTLGVSALVVEEPVVQLEVDESGELLGRSFPREQAEAPKDGTPSKRSSFAIYVKRIEVKNGTLTLRDRRLKELNEIRASQINLRLDNFRFPLTDAVSTVKLTMKLAGKLVSGSVAIDGSVDLMREGFNLALEGDSLAAVDLPGKGPQARIEKMSLHASSQGTDAKLIEISDVNLQKPSIQVQIDKEGRLVTPLLTVIQAETGTTKAGPAQEKKAEAPSQSQVVFKGLKISQGEALILDGKVATPPHTIRLTDVSLSVDQAAIPPQDTWTAYECSLNIPGKESTGVLRASGKTKLKSLDTASKVSLQGLDITTVKPYTQKTGDVDVTSGTVSLDLDLHIDKRNLNSPAKAVLRNLQFASGKGSGEKFMAIPRSAVISFLQANNNEIALDFMVAGSIDDPKFSLRETMATRFAVQLADKLGLGILNSGGKLITEPAKGLRGLGEALKDAPQSLKKLFNK